jgi:hypothetical protein
LATCHRPKLKSNSPEAQLRVIVVGFVDVAQLRPMVLLILLQNLHALVQLRTILILLVGLALIGEISRTSVRLASQLRTNLPFRNASTPNCASRSFHPHLLAHVLKLVLIVKMVVMKPLTFVRRIVSLMRMLVYPITAQLKHLVIMMNL